MLFRHPLGQVPGVLVRVHLEVKGVHLEEDAHVTDALCQVPVLLEGGVAFRVGQDGFDVAVLHLLQPAENRLRRLGVSSPFHEFHHIPVGGHHRPGFPAADPFHDVLRAVPFRAEIEFNLRVGFLCRCLQAVENIEGVRSGRGKAVLLSVVRGGEYGADTFLPVQAEQLQGFLHADGAVIQVGQDMAVDIRGIGPVRTAGSIRRVFPGNQVGVPERERRQDVKLGDGFGCGFEGDIEGGSGSGPGRGDGSDFGHIFLPFLSPGLLPHARCPGRVAGDFRLPELIHREDEPAALEAELGFVLQEEGIGVGVLVVFVPVTGDGFLRGFAPDLLHFRAVEDHAVQHEHLHGRGDRPEDFVGLFAVLPLPAEFQADGALVIHVHLNGHEEIVIGEQVVGDAAEAQAELFPSPDLVVRLVAFVHYPQDVLFHGFVAVLVVLLPAFDGVLGLQQVAHGFQVVPMAQLSLVVHPSHPQGGIREFAILHAVFKLVPADVVNQEAELQGAVRVRRTAHSLCQHIRQLVHGFNHIELFALLEPHAGFLVVPLPGMAAVIAEVSEGIRVAAVLGVFLFQLPQGVI